MTYVMKPKFDHYVIVILETGKEIMTVDTLQEGEEEIERLEEEE